MLYSKWVFAQKSRKHVTGNRNCIALFSYQILVIPLTKFFMNTSIFNNHDKNDLYGR